MADDQSFPEYIEVKLPALVEQVTPALIGQLMATASLRGHNQVVVTLTCLEAAIRVPSGTTAEVLQLLLARDCPALSVSYVCHLAGAKQLAPEVLAALLQTAVAAVAVATPLVQLAPAAERQREQQLFSLRSLVEIRRQQYLPTAAVHDIFTTALRRHDTEAVGQLLHLRDVQSTHYLVRVLRLAIQQRCFFRSSNGQNSSNASRWCWMK